MSKITCLCGYGSHNEKFSGGETMIVQTLNWLEYAEKMLEEEWATGAPPVEKFVQNPEPLTSQWVEIFECPACHRLLVYKGGDFVSVYQKEQQIDATAPKELHRLIPVVPEQK